MIVAGKSICRYVIVRFKPYPETGEFVNVGVVTAFPQVGKVDFRIETTHTKRVTDFFDEIKYDLYRTQAKRFYNAFDHIRDKFEDSPLFQRDEAVMNEYFDTITKQHDELFCFSGQRVKFTADVENETLRLFDFYVKQTFTRQSIRHEQEMKTKIRKQLNALDVLKEYTEQVLKLKGGVRLKIPFGSFDDDNHFKKAIRPIYLGYKNPVRIIEHGGGWIYRLRRAAEEGKLPQRTLILLGGLNEDYAKLDMVNTIADDISKIDDIEIVKGIDIEPIERFVEGAS